MNVQITWGTRVVYVPKSELTLIQASPTEIYELNLNEFRLALKDQEDSEEGIAFPDTHLHYTEVTLGGLTFARVVAMINNFTVTFEDGQYAVNLVGANSNVGDVVNVNQVSVRSQNSAGLISTPLIEYSSFFKGVTLDAINGVAGTVFPTGTPIRPVNNVQDAKTIAEYRGFSNIFVIGDYTFNTGDDIRNMIISGQTSELSNITINSGAQTDGATIRGCTLDGVVDSGCWVEQCVIGDLSYSEGRIHDCTLTGTITLTGSDLTVVSNCISGVPHTNPPTFNIGGSGRNLVVRDFHGPIKFTNLTGDQQLCLGINEGSVILDSSITAGTIQISGVTVVTDNSTGTTVDEDGAVSKLAIARQQWQDIGHAVHYDASSSYSGTEYPVGTSVYPVNNLADAHVLGTTYGKNTLCFVGKGIPVVLTGELDWSRWMFEGSSTIAQDILSGDSGNPPDVSDCRFDKVTVTGKVTGVNHEFERCFLYNISGLDGTILLKDVGVAGTITLDAGAIARGIGVHLQGNPTVIDLNSGNTVLQLNCYGDLQIENATGSSFVDLGVMDGGSVIRTASCTGGTVYISGEGSYTDQGTGANLVNTLLNTDTIEAKLATEHGSGAWTGDAASLAQILSLIQDIHTIETGRWKIDADNNQMVFYGDDDSTPIFTFDLFDADGLPTVTDILERRPAS